MEQAPSRRLALLIDGDNAQPGLIEAMLAEASKYGLVTIRRIYGDWTKPEMKGWKDSLHHHAIQPIQQFRYTTGKNSTDSALIIGAMDTLYEGSVQGFCIVSSDSDYTRLATRIPEKGLFVMGIGEEKTPKAFVNACEIFVFVENLLGDAAISAAPRKRRVDAQASQPDPLPLLKRAVEITMDDSGWAFLGAVGTALRQLDPSFDPRSFGYRQLSQLVKSQSANFEIREKTGQGGSSSVYVKPKE